MPPGPGSVIVGSGTSTMLPSLPPNTTRKNSRSDDDHHAADQVEPEGVRPRRVAPSRQHHPAHDAEDRPEQERVRGPARRDRHAQCPQPPGERMERAREPVHASRVSAHQGRLSDASTAAPPPMPSRTTTLSPMTVARDEPAASWVSAGSAPLTFSPAALWPTATGLLLPAGPSGGLGPARPAVPAVEGLAGGHRRRRSASARADTLGDRRTGCRVVRGRLMGGRCVGRRAMGGRPVRRWPMAAASWAAASSVAGAAAGSGAIPGAGAEPWLWLSENDQPSKPPGIASRFIGPAEL